MKFQTGRIRPTKRFIEHLENCAVEVCVKPTHRNRTGCHVKYVSSTTADLINFITLSGKSSRVDVVTDSSGELVSCKAYRTHWSDTFTCKFRQ